MAIAEEREQGAVLLVEVQHEGLDLRDAEDMDTGKELEHPTRRRPVRGLAALAGKGASMLLQRAPNAVFERAIDQSGS
ncbi:MAG: hypothetical protein PHE55_14305 [Methylococcaceae bacterium]|nr:hypothetical protein [Methylococcaceae bacterium]